MYLGWIVKEKEIEELLEAWEGIAQEYSEWKLELVGPYKQEYYEYLKEKYSFEGVDFLGEKEHNKAMNYLNQAEIFVLPSYSEGCPYVILEAMTLGKAVIATGVGDIRQMLSEESGLAIKPRDIESIRFWLIKMIENVSYRKQLGLAAKKRVCQEYCIEKILEQYRKIWDEIQNI